MSDVINGICKVVCVAENASAGDTVLIKEFGTQKTWSEPLVNGRAVFLIPGKPAPARPNSRGYQVWLYKNGSVVSGSSSWFELGYGDHKVVNLYANAQPATHGEITYLQNQIDNVNNTATDAYNKATNVESRVDSIIASKLSKSDLKIIPKGVYVTLKAASMASIENFNIDISESGYTPLGIVGMNYTSDFIKVNAYLSGRNLRGTASGIGRSGYSTDYEYFVAFYILYVKE